MWKNTGDGVRLEKLKRKNYSPEMIKAQIWGIRMEKKELMELDGQGWGEKGEPERVR